MFKSEDLKEIVIIDFGISKIVRTDVTTKLFACTANYSPPEVLTSNYFYKESDIFSFGMYYFFLNLNLVF